MAEKKRGRPAGAKGFTEAERDAIRRALQVGFPVKTIAALMGRGRATVYRQMERMRDDGTIGQGVFDLGQVPDHDATA